MALDLDALDRGELPNKTYRAVDGEHQAADRLRRVHQADARTTPGAPEPLFIAARPRADRYVYVLLRDLTKLDAVAGDAGRVWYERHRHELTVTDGSTWINRLKAKIASYKGRPVAAPAPVDTFYADGAERGSITHAQATRYAANAARRDAPAYDPYDDILDGNYAIQADGEKTHFYRVSRKEGKGQYAGRTFVNVQERASESLFRIYDRARRTTILNDIRTAGPEASRLMFAERLGRCWHCFLALTDEDNPYKIHGLGPICGPNVMG